MQDAGCWVLHHSRSGCCHACLPLMCLSIMPAGPACPNACPECLRVPSHPHLIISPLMKAQVSSPASLSSPIAHCPSPIPPSSGPSELSPQILASIYFCPCLLPSPSTFCLTSSSPQPRLIQLLLCRPLLLGCLFPPSARRRSLIFPFLADSLPLFVLLLLRIFSPLPCRIYCKSLALLLRPNYPTHLS